MPSEDAKRMKEAFLTFLDLIIIYRIKATIGKTGLTYIPQSKLDEIQGLELETYIRQLINDKILGTIPKDSDSLFWDKTADGGDAEIIIDCIKSAEEIRVYMNSLVVEDGWVSIRIDPPEREGAKYKMYKRSLVEKVIKLSHNEGKLMEYLKIEDNRNKPRTMIARELSLAEDKISNLKNNLKRKLRKLDFSEESLSQMLPTYQR